MKISLKYKLLTVLIIVPLLTISTYILITTDLFEQDKMAYIFESSQSINGSISNQFNSRLELILDSSNMLIEGFNPNINKFSLSTKRYLETNRAINRVYIIDKKSGAIITQLIKKNSPLEHITFKTDIIKTVSKIDYITLAMAKKEEGLFWLVRDIINSKNGKSYSLIILCNLGKVLDSFVKDSSYQHYIFDTKQNSVLFSNNDMDLTSISLGEKLSTIKQKTMTFQKRSINNKILLITASRTILPAINIISIVEKDKALSTIKLFIKKSLIFLAFSISVAILIGLFASNKLTKAFRKLNQATSQVSRGDFDISLNIKSGDEVEELAENFNIMGEKISELMVETKEKARMEAELQTARLVQSTLFPPPEVTIGNYQISGHCTPCSECGGDWWHYHETEDYLYIWIGDATGHGASAALMTSAIASTVEMVLFAKRLTLSAMINLLNKSLIRVSGGKIFITLFMAKINKSTGELTYCNSAHEPPLLFRKAEKYSKKNLIPLNEVNGPRLCQEANTEYQEHTIQLEKDDTILFYTDGITEAKNCDQKEWGEGRFIRTCTKELNSTTDLHRSKAEILNKFNEFIEDTPLDDDLTFFLCRVLGTPNTI